MRRDNRSQTTNQRGFTIIELLVATTIFTLVLLMAVAGVVQLTRMYYRGVVQARTQEVARTVIDELAETIRFSNDIVELGGFSVTGPDIVLGGADVAKICIGSKRYTYVIDRQMDSSLPDVNYTTMPPTGWPTTKHKKHVLWVDQPDAGCVATTANAYVDTEDPTYDQVAAMNVAQGGRELLSENMRLTRFQITEITESGAPNRSFRINVGVAYGDDDLLEVSSDGNYKECNPSAPGSEFCAASNLSVVVVKRQTE